MINPREKIRELLDRDLSHAKDSIARAEYQLKRMPFDHDTRNALEGYRVWESEIETAIIWLNRIGT
jgi:hypothetical protein